MTITPIDQSLFSDALESALDILDYYDGDEHESLAEESVIDSLHDEFDLSFDQAQQVLAHALSKRLGDTN